MRLGGSLPGPYEGPESWAQGCQEMGYAAATCPLPRGAGAEEAKALRKAAKAAGIHIAEVGVWKNCLSSDDQERKDNLAYAKERLALAEELGVACCVNVSGARGEQWDGAYPENYSKQTYALIVDSVREIIDAVKPKRAFYTLEPMPWMLPDSVKSYLRLIRDINRKQFAVHMDYANMINRPQRFLNSKRFIADSFKQLAPYIKSVHLKDVRMDRKALPSVLRECPPGKGDLDFAHILRQIDRRLPRDIPVLLEHMDQAEDYREALQYVKGIAFLQGIATA